MQRSGIRPSAGVAAVLALALSGCGSAKPRPPLGAGHERLPAGTQTLDLVAREDAVGGLQHLPRIELTVPAGWFNYRGWALLKGGRGDSIAVSFWDVDQVYPTPCKWKYESMLDPGRGIGGLASALARQPLRNATMPRSIDLAGFRGKYLEWSVPAGISFDWSAPQKAWFPRCDEGTFQSWTARGWNSDRYQQAPGQVDQLWILDVNGERLLIDASRGPHTTAAERAELAGVVDSIRFVE
jgi:hypothetical protein